MVQLLVTKIVLEVEICRSTKIFRSGKIQEMRTFRSGKIQTIRSGKIKEKTRTFGSGKTKTRNKNPWTPFSPRQPSRELSLSTGISLISPQPTKAYAGTAPVIESNRTR